MRAASLAIVGVLLIAIPLLSLAHANLLLEIAGAVLVVRGIGRRRTLPGFGSKRAR